MEEDVVERRWSGGVSVSNGEGRGMVGRQMAAGIDEIIVIVLEEVCVPGNPLRNRASARSCSGAAVSAL